MATYGKTLREEIRVSGGAEEDYVLGSPNINLDCEDKPSRPAPLSFVVLLLGLALIFSGKWIAAIIVFAVYFVMIRRAPRGAFYQKSDDWGLSFTMMNGLTTPTASVRTPGCQ